MRINGFAAWVKRRLVLVIVLVISVGLLSWLASSTFAAIDDRNRSREDAAERTQILTRQTLVIERDLTALRIRAEQTADCPVLYLRDLLAESAKPVEESNLAGVNIPVHCRAHDLADLEERLRRVEAEIALFELRRRAAVPDDLLTIFDGLGD